MNTDTPTIPREELKEKLEGYEKCLSLIVNLNAGGLTDRESYDLLPILRACLEELERGEADTRRLDSIGRVDDSPLSRAVKICILSDGHVDMVADAETFYGHKSLRDAIDAYVLWLNAQDSAITTNQQEAE